MNGKTFWNAAAVSYTWTNALAAPIVTVLDAWQDWHHPTLGTAVAVGIWAAATTLAWWAIIEYAWWPWRMKRRGASRRNESGGTHDHIEE